MKLQQHLPFTVLKPPNVTIAVANTNTLLQQHLPFTVLKRIVVSYNFETDEVATAPTVYGIETHSTVTLTNTT